MLYNQIQRNRSNMDKVNRGVYRQEIDIFGGKQVYGIEISIGIHILSVQGQSGTRPDQEIYMRIGDTVFRAFLALLRRFFAFFRQLLVLVQFPRGHMILLYDLASYIQEMGHRTQDMRETGYTSTNQDQRIQGSYIRTSILRSLLRIQQQLH